MNQTFYMVFIEGGQTPAYKHETLQLAEAEAKRLARITRKKAYVLVTIKSLEINEFLVVDCRPKIIEPIIQNSSDDLPF